MLPKREPNENVLRELRRWHDTLALKNKIINCKNCHVEVRSLGNEFLILQLQENAICDEHQNEIATLKREYTESGWW